MKNFFRFLRVLCSIAVILYSLFHAATPFTKSHSYLLSDFFTARNLAITYLVFGTVIALLHPRLFRPTLSEIWSINDLGVISFVFKSVMTVATYLLYLSIWPIGLFNVSKSEKKRKANQEKLLARFEILRMHHTAMNPSTKNSGGDGSSFDKAVILDGANFANGSRATYNFIELHYPGCKHTKQSLKVQEGRSFDVLQFITENGEAKVMYFDITSQFQA